MFGSSLYCKVVFVGDSGTGKTSIIYHLLDRSLANVRNTIGSAEFSYEGKNAGGDPVQMTIWDTAGQDVYQALIPTYVRSAKAVLFTFDLTREETFDSIPTWVSQVKTTADPPLKYFIGNKADLERERKISFDQGDGCALDLGGRYFETSAVTGSGIEALMADICQAISVRMGCMDNHVPLGQGDSKESCC
jgi:small GTP-binding protein